MFILEECVTWTWLRDNTHFVICSTRILRVISPSQNVINRPSLKVPGVIRFIVIKHIL
jgi:hypothetical protein